MPAPTTDPLQWLTTNEVAGLLRKSAGWVTKQRKTGALPHLKVGRSIRFYRRDVEAFQQTFQPAEQPAPQLAQVIHLRPAA